MDYMDELFAQREHFINAFYATKQNVDDNRNKLIACAYQLSKEQDSLFFQSDVAVVLSVLANDKMISETRMLLILQLYVHLYDNAELLIDGLYQNNSAIQEKLALKLALILGIKNIPLSISYNEKVLNEHLLASYYRQRFEELSAFSQSFSEQVTPLTRLYLNALNTAITLEQSLLNEFIGNDYLNSELFELYVISLPQDLLVTLIEQLSSNSSSEFINVVIKVVGLAGYSQYIPLLARYLQDKSYALVAHCALRTIMGEDLDKLIPEYIQFNSDESERIQDLPYYGAKILHHWGTHLASTLPEQLLSGLPITEANLDLLLQTGSQVHRRVAALHKTQYLNNSSFFYYSCPEVVL